MLKLLRRSLPPSSASALALATPSVEGPVEPAPVVSSPGGGEESVGVLLEAVSGLLHAIGRYALDTETSSHHEAQALADRWRRHVTIGLDHPDEAAGGATDGADAAAPARGGAVMARDWPGMLRFAVAQQRGERERAVRVQDELRDTIWKLVRGLSDVVGSESAAGRATTATLDRLRAAIDEAPAERVRDAALGALGDLATLVAERERARRDQVAALGDEVVRLGAALEEARREGAIDPLTGFGNRRAFDEALAHAATLHALWDHSACLIVFDVDGLRAVNEVGGHPAGDEAIRGVAAELSRVFLRRSDALCRFGGDEFAVVLRDTTPVAARRLAERVVAAVAARASARVMDGASDRRDAATYGVSAGVAGLGDGESVAAWLARADVALRAAKQERPGRVVVG